MADPDFTLDESLLSSMPSGLTGLSLEAIASEQSAILLQLNEFDPIKTATAFAGLLTVPELQSNCVRLEALVHLTLAKSHGQRKPSNKLVTKLFAAMNDGICGRAEDPAEDVFVSSVGTPRGNFRILEGTWESAGFFLQRFVNIVEGMPTEGAWGDVRECVYAILKLSEELCERSKLVRSGLGNQSPKHSLPGTIASNLGGLRRAVRFSEGELDALGISVDHLHQFIFNPTDRPRLLSETIGNSTLERFPVLWRDDEFFFVLPTATSGAIRRFIVERMDASGLREAFLAALAHEYAETFSRIPLMGGHIGAPIEFRRTKAGLLGGALTKIERGRFLNFVFFVDTLEGFEATGLGGHNHDPTALNDDVEQWIDHAYDAARQEDGFRDGITMLVSCGVGRGVAFTFEHAQRPHWYVEFINAPDLYTLSWVNGFKPLSLWRLVEATDKLESLGVSLHNVNGLLNMVAWKRSLDGHLVPHADLPDDFVSPDHGAFVMIEQNALRKLRYAVATNWDPHVEQDVRGRWLRVRKDTQSEFEEDRKRPSYACEERPDGRWLPGVYVTEHRPWWCEIEVTDNTSSHFAFERWRMVTLWLSRAAPVLEMVFPELPAGPILWRTLFEGTISNLDGNTVQIDYADARKELTVTADPTNHTITLVAQTRFETAHFNPDNNAERALVDAFVQGVGDLCGRDLDDNARRPIVDAIVPDTRARQTHMFRTRSFRDYVQSSLPSSVTLIDQDDGATLKLGLGWQLRNRADGPIIRGKSECIDFLNGLTRLVEDELVADLRVFSRLPTIRILLRNHEAAVIDRVRWSRTAAAVLSLHDDKMAAMETMARHDYKLNGVFQATRLLIEIGICECPLIGGHTPSKWDLSRLMSKMMLVQQLGGWSDAIRWDVMEPSLRVTPLGDVHAKLDFIDNVIEPFARTTSDMRVNDAVEDYTTNLIEPEIRKSVENELETQFLDAWKEETGASLDETRVFLDFLEDLALREKKAVVQISKSALLAVQTENDSLSAGTATAIVEFLTLHSRPHWRDVPAGYDDKDRQPWRFRRRLSVLRKPLLQIDDAEDPTILCAPGLVRDAVMYMLQLYHRGDFPARQLKKNMRAWAGKLRDREGNQFTREVAGKLGALGWRTHAEVKITKLLRQGFDRDYGDVDVLAWNQTSGRVLVIECKDVQYRKTYGEVAEQLADFRGEIGTDGKPDYLRRHLDRVDLIRQHLAAIAAYLKVDAIATVESHLVFKNPVPMEFALKHMAQRVSVHIFDKLEGI